MIHEGVCRGGGREVGRSLGRVLAGLSLDDVVPSRLLSPSRYHLRPSRKSGKSLIEG